MKVIFFDIDGVLNTTKTTRMFCGFHFVDTRKVLRLREIVERTGAELVMSSSWRYGFEPGAFWYEREGVALLEAEFHRLRCPKWIDVTPWLSGAKRQKEIFAWLTVHPEVDEFIIIDDVGEELTWFWDRLVLTDPMVGLNKERMEFAIQLLGEKND
jgi:hypothetical protein